MTGETVYVICILSCVAFSSFVSYSGEESRFGRFALGIILLAALALPIFSSLKNISVADFDFESEMGSPDIRGQVAEESYCRGIALAVADKFSLSCDDICVSCENFCIDNVSAERICVTLGGSAIYSDRHAIAAYVEKISKCEVSVGFE